MEHIINELDTSIEGVYVQNNNEDVLFILRMNTSVLSKLHIFKRTSKFGQKFDPLLIIKKTDRLKANYPFYIVGINILSGLSFLTYSNKCIPLSCNENLCTLFKTNKLSSEEWQMRPPCKTASGKFAIFDTNGSSVLDINDNLDMLFKIKNLSLEDAIIITKVKNELR